MCNCVIGSRPCQSNTESADMPRLQTLVTRPDASNHLSHVIWVFRITLRSSVSKHLRFGISTPCRDVSFASDIPTFMCFPSDPPDLLRFLLLSSCTIPIHLQRTILQSSQIRTKELPLVFLLTSSQYQLSHSTNLSINSLCIH